MGDHDLPPPPPSLMPEVGEGTAAAAPREDEDEDGGGGGGGTPAAAGGAADGADGTKSPKGLSDIMMFSCDERVRCLRCVASSARAPPGVFINYIGRVKLMAPETDCDYSSPLRVVAG
mmetsp:Transcript_22001/g.65125  ORF Transcript_22001/g.65125 Transcript_22001/m.65125 type:complete len:118 (-) Transcript_22001:134-487(-)